MNEQEKSGLHRAIDSAWDNLPKFVVAALVALAVFVGGFWDSYRQLSSTVDGIKDKQLPNQLCSRIHDCPCIDAIEESIAGVKLSSKESTEHISSHNRESEEWKQRIRQLEQWRYEFSTRPGACPDPFTGTMGRDLEQRIQSLESKR